MVVQNSDEKAIRITFEKLQKWMQGEENKSIDNWLEHDDKSYETFNWLINHCAANGWVSTEVNMLDHADEEGKAIAKTLWMNALNFAEGEKND